jgi:hypothetical protein
LVTIPAFRDRLHVRVGLDVEVPTVYLYVHVSYPEVRP